MGDDTSVVVLEGEKTVGESLVKSKAAPATESPTPSGSAEGATAAAATAAAPAEEVDADPTPESRVPHAEPVAAATRKRKAGQEVPPVGEAKAAARAAAKPATAVVGLVGGVKLEDLAPAVRKRMDEVLQKGEDGEMRQDVRLINFLGEVEEAQVRCALVILQLLLLL